MDKVVMKAKWENYWYYYKVHTFVAIFAIMIIAYTIASSIGQKDTALNVTLLGGVIDEGKRISMQEQATKMFITDPKKEISIVFTPFISTAQDPSNAAVIQKIVAQAAVKDLDILVLDKDLFAAYANQGMFMRLDNVSELSGLGSSQYKLVKAKVEGQSDEVPCGIDAKDIEMLKDTGFDVDNKVLGVVVSSKRMDLNLKFLKWLLKLQG